MPGPLDNQASRTTRNSKLEELTEEQDEVTPTPHPRNQSIDGSLDLSSSGPASPEPRRVSSTHHFAGLFQPSIEELDSALETYLRTEEQLKNLLERIYRGELPVLEF